MRIRNETVFRALAGDPSRWLYVLSDLSDPVRSSGIRCYAASPENIPASLATVFDGEEECLISVWGSDPGPCGEAMSDPAVGEAVSAGRRVLTACYSSLEPPRVPGLVLSPSDRQVLDRWGIFGEPMRPLFPALPEHISVSRIGIDEARTFAGWDPAVWGRLPELASSIGDGDLFWLARETDSGDPLGYLWAAEAGFGFCDIVNLYVRKDRRRRGTGTALAGRFAADLALSGIRAYYGVAASPESAELAKKLGFRPLFPPPALWEIEIGSTPEPG